MAIWLNSEFKKLVDSLVGKESKCFFDHIGELLPASFRFNPLKHNRRFQTELLRAEGFQIRPTQLEDSFEISSGPRPIGKSLTHFLGDIYIQDLASMLPGMILDPRPGERVLDLCASPGSKTSLLAGRMRNKGILVANDISMKRIRSLIFNLRKFGATNTVVLKWFGEQFGNQYFEYFDRVLLDPPCSALGTLHKSPEVLNWWKPENSRRLAINQVGLLVSALKALRPGGKLVYSTCTLTPQENESVLDFALKTYPVELEDLEIHGLVCRPGLTESGQSTFHPSLKKAIRLYPHENPCEGFFIASIRKLESFGRQRLRRQRMQVGGPLRPDDREIRKRLDSLVADYDLPLERFLEGRYWPGSELAFLRPELAEFPLYDEPVRMGLPIAHTRTSRTKLTTEGTHWIGAHARKLVVELKDFAELQSYVNRVSLPTTLPRTPQVLVRFRGEPVGHAMIDEGEVLSRFPRIGWDFHLPGEDTVP